MRGLQSTGTPPQMTLPNTNNAAKPRYARWLVSFAVHGRRFFGCESEAADEPRI